jgi:peptide/nickel transport system permease protein
MSDSFAVFVARRLVAAVAVAVAASALTFVMLHVLAPENFDDTRSLPVELWHFLVGVFLHFDFGDSRQPPFRPVIDMLGDSLGADISVVVGALVAGFLLGTIGGVICVRRGGVVSAVLQFAATVLLCAPVYVVGLLLILVFSPAVGAPVPIFLVEPNAYHPLAQDPLGWLRALIVPWFVAGAPLAGMTLRMVRATLPEVYEQDFMRTALGKGLPARRITVRHALPVAIPPALSLAGSYIPLLLGNVVLVEGVFGIPGVWRYIPRALENGDFNLLQALVVVGAVFVVASNTVVDLTLAAIDPRVRT